MCIRRCMKNVYGNIVYNGKNVGNNLIATSCKMKNILYM